MSAKPLSRWTDEEILDRLALIEPRTGYNDAWSEEWGREAAALREVLRLRAGLREIALGLMGRREKGDKSERFDHRIARDLLAGKDGSK